mmetsp:Transcript_27904/g.33890  ORF Transcript_27904/g.33890 Transcript_27904/m.33890 type:complete len:211 (+) Transcript_27904:3508-4140(+)
MHRALEMLQDGCNRDSLLVHTCLIDLTCKANTDGERVVVHVGLSELLLFVGLLAILRSIRVQCEGGTIICRNNMHPTRVGFRVTPCIDITVDVLQSKAELALHSTVLTCNVHSNPRDVHPSFKLIVCTVNLEVVTLDVTSVLQDGQIRLEWMRLNSSLEENVLVIKNDSTLVGVQWPVTRLRSLSEATTSVSRLSRERTRGGAQRVQDSE